MSESIIDPPADADAIGGDADLAALGDAGKNALDRMKGERNDAKRIAADLQKQLDALNQASESALEKAQREAAEAREDAIKATSDALRFRVAAEHGISNEDADLFLTGADSDTLQRQAARLAEKAPASGTPKPDLTQGGSGKPPVALNSNDLTNALRAAVGAK